MGRGCKALAPFHFTNHMAKNIVKKTYKAYSLFSITVIAGNARKHLSFFGLTNGGSYFTTEDPELQKALESSKFFGDVFFLHETKIKEDKKPAKETEASVEDAPKEVKKVDIAGMQEAKEYLADRFGVSRASIRTKAAILAAAEEHNIEFVGI